MTPTLTARDHLSLQYDGRIPPGLLATARAADRAAAAARADREGRIRVGRITMLPATAAALMARAIVEAAIARGRVERTDFERLGLEPDQIDALRSRAFALACLDEPRVPQMIGEAP